MNVSIAAEAGAESRREPRLPVAVGIASRQLGQVGDEARLINLSSRGFMAEVADRISPGVRVWLTLPGLPRVNALVVWSRDGRIGGEFAEPIDPLKVFQAAGEGAG